MAIRITKDLLRVRFHRHALHPSFNATEPSVSFFVDMAFVIIVIGVDPHTVPQRLDIDSGCPVLRPLNANGTEIRLACYDGFNTVVRGVHYNVTLQVSSNDSCVLASGSTLRTADSSGYVTFDDLVFRTTVPAPATCLLRFQLPATYGETGSESAKERDNNSSHY